MSKAPPMRGWVTDGTTLMKGGEFIQALKLSGNLIETRLRSSRGRLGAPRQCRHGCRALESLGHVQQTCPFTHDFRVWRHDRMIGRIASLLERKGWMVEKEPCILTREGLRKPDLLCCRGNEVVVLDGQVCSDAGIALPDQAHSNKVAYYNKPDIINNISNRLGMPPVFSSATLSWLGSWQRPLLTALDKWASQRRS